MLKFITKKQWWDILDTKIPHEIEVSSKMGWHLKTIQDAVAFFYLQNYRNSSIAEIGGGDSRLLPVLARTNTCFNIDEFQGVGEGPRKAIKIEGVTNLLTKIGNFSDMIEDNQFDVIYSISVLEHVPQGKIDDFFKDCHRILVDSGLMIHLIDVYLENAGGDNLLAARRVCEYGKYLDGNLFMPIETPDIIGEPDVCFSTAFATNPDDRMLRWNRSVPNLKNKREQAQSCSLLMIGQKVGKTSDAK